MYGVVFSLKMCSSGVRGGKMQFKAKTDKCSVVVSEEMHSKMSQAKDSFSHDVQHNSHRPAIFKL